MRRFGLVFLLGFWIFFLPEEVFSQSFNFNTKPRGIDLPVQNILDIEQDTLGQLWFSTSRGVVYSDGIYTHNLPDTLVRKFSYRIAILKDPDGKIWLYNATGTPNLFRGTENSWIEEKIESIDPEVISDRNRFFSLQRGNLTLFLLDTQQGLIFWEKGGTKQRLESTRLDYGHLLHASVIDSEFVLNFEKATMTFDQEKLREVNWKGVPLPSPPVQITPSPAGDSYYFLGKNYLYRGMEPFFPTELIDEGIGAYDFSEEPFFGMQFSGNALFYHFNSQLRKYSPGRNQIFRIDLFPLFQTPLLQTFMVDQEGILWLGSSRGLASNNSQIFQNYSSRETGFLGNEVTAIHEIAQGSYLLGFNNGIQRMARYGIEDVLKDTFMQDSPAGRIMNFSRDKYGRVWFSRNQLGLGYIDAKTNQVREIPTPKGVSFSAVFAYGDSLLMVGSKNIFIANLQDGLDRLFENEITQEITSFLGGVPAFYRKAVLLKDGRIVILRASQLENKYPIIEKNGFLLAEGYDVMELDNGGLLIGTESGLRVFQSGYLGYYQYAGQVITQPVYTLMKTPDGAIWVGTDQGVFVLSNNQLVQYRESNGLVGDEINRGALVQAQNGRVLIGTQKGLSIFLPQEEFFAAGPPNLHVRNLTLGGDLVIGNEPFEVAYGKNFLQAQLITPAFNESRDLWIHYRLLGQKDESWQIIKNPDSNQLFFSNLPPGEYQLEVQASYDGKDFSSLFVSPKMTVLQPFYLQLWFLIIAVLFLVGLGILLSRFYQQLKNLGLLQSRVEREQKSKNLAELQFKNVWNNAQDPMLLTLEGKRIFTANPAFARMLGLRLEELEGRDFFDFLKVSDEDKLQSEEILNQIRNAGSKGFTLEGTFFWKTGPLEMEVSSVIVEEDFEGKSLILSVFRDLTIQKSVQARLQEAKEKAEEASRFKTSLLSNISHEIRTPLTGIIGGAEHIMMVNPDDEKLQSQLDIILQSGERLLSTINSLLDLAKIEANKMEVIYTPTDLQDYFGQLIKPLRKVAELKQLYIEEDLRCAAGVGMIDRRFTEMILNNLVGNAIKYSKSGTIRVSIWVEGELLKMKIEDQGQGISEDFQRKMFEPFEQESTGHRRQYDGTGLGLAITKNLLVLLHGTIEIHSKINEGTLVKLEIPLPQT